ncbi:aminotransferase class IV [Paenibacillus woosongensis]|uniref:Branched-chain amino acid aminotransferase n=1 Tax=Paenibacillus woosongensis TaxID=307580 RepID=A0A7X2YXT0_9BACL|nr:aminotransferase class IV [Paenibacillus woosongensis]MUG43847.1 branched-chain amino acid aminotransferase [Paenibacillus woosongensis]
MKECFIQLNDRVVPYEEATIHVGSAAMKYGASVFEGIRGYWDADRHRMHLFSLSEHVDRLLDSMKIMGMEHSWNKKRVIGNIRNIILVNHLQEDCYVRVAASVEADGSLEAKGPVLLSVAVFPQQRKPHSDRGIHISVSSWQRISDQMMPPRIKCIANYQNGRLAMLQAKSDGYDNTLLLNQHGKIAEAPTAAFFIVKNGRLITPSVTSGILESITRRHILNWAKEMGLTAEERELDRTECYLADEAFLCGTGAEILPVISVDRYELGGGSIGPVTALLMNKYFNTAYVKEEGLEPNLEDIVTYPKEEIENAALSI